jgi:hypothetical protein
MTGDELPDDGRELQMTMVTNRAEDDDGGCRRV